MLKAGAALARSAVPDNHARRGTSDNHSRPRGADHQHRPVLAEHFIVEVDADHRIAAEARGFGRSEEHTSELQSLMRISYAVFCLKKNKILLTNKITYIHDN